LLTRVREGALTRQVAARVAEPLATLGQGWPPTASFVIEVYRYQQAHQANSVQYFQGQSPLFPDLENALAVLVEQAENVVTMFNDHLDFQTRLRGKRKRKDFVPDQPLNLEDLLHRAELAAQHHVEVLVGMARAEASLLLGERKEAYRCVEPLVWGRGDHP
jgi:hypothetical protein